jgi:hypothetical protein
LARFLLLLQAVFPKLNFLAHPSYLDDEIEGNQDIGDAKQQPNPVVFIMGGKKDDERGILLKKAFPGKSYLTSWFSGRKLQRTNTVHRCQKLRKGALLSGKN